MANIARFLAQISKRNIGLKHVVVAAPHDVATLLAIDLARQELNIEAILVGDRKRILVAAEMSGVNLEHYEVLSVVGDLPIAESSVRLISEGKGHVLMKGIIDTSVLLKQVLKKEYGLRTGSLLSHTALLLPPNEDHYYLLTDAGMNISPSLLEKKKIIENSVQMAHALGNPKPNVAMLCAKEKVYEKMPATLDAEALKKLCAEGEIEGCIVSGPLQLDLAISRESASMKECDDPVAGNVDIFVAPTIEVGNVFGKALKYMGGYAYAGVVLGAKIPVVVVSRSDSEQEKLLSIAMACAGDFGSANQNTKAESELEGAL
ncbi:phosphate acyltransferase [Vibrio nomapromontoriensis]|uniref:phosphate acyltransferase n=1 Tax=Vibrio nomapromontoriensis TaxID=2910246 RepID=UPI003D0B5571